MVLLNAKTMKHLLGIAISYSLPPHLASRAQPVAVGRLVLAGAAFEPASQAVDARVRASASVGVLPRDAVGTIGGLVLARRSR